MTDALVSDETDWHVVAEAVNEAYMNGEGRVYEKGLEAAFKAAGLSVAHSDAIERLTRERDELYRIALAATNATDGAAVDGVSIEFLSHLAEEVAAVKSQRDAARAELAGVRNTALEEAAAKVPANWLHPDVAHMLGGNPIVPSDVELAMQKVAIRIRALKSEA